MNVFSHNISFLYQYLLRRPFDTLRVLLKTIERCQYKLVLGLYILIFIINAAPLMPQQKAIPKRIIFFGDSITELGVKPNGYISKLKEFIQQAGKAEQFELLGAGISGNKVYDLFVRFEEDVLAKKPALLVMFVGINDVWHKTLTGTGTDAPKFENIYEKMILKAQRAGIKIIVCTPPLIGEKTDHTNYHDGDLNKYAGIIRNLASKHSTGLCDLRKIFVEYNLKNNPKNLEFGILTNDRVHLNDKGNELLAQEILPLIYNEK